jgi:hypothetical protein
MRVSVDEPVDPLDAARGYRADGRHLPDLVIAWRWYEGRSTVAMLIFCALWDAFLIGWYGFCWRAWASEKATLVLLLALFPCFHVWLGLRLTYQSMASLVNTTRVTLRGGELTVRHGPVWHRGRRLAVRSIRALGWEKRVERGRRSSTTSYELLATVDGGDRVRVLAGLPSEEHARFLQHVIGEHLGPLPRLSPWPTP